MNNRMDNYVESVFHELAEMTVESPAFDQLYDGFVTDRLTRLFSTLHSALLESFKSLNSRLPTGEEGAHFWAEDSRRLIALIDIVAGLRENLVGGGYAFTMESYYSDTLEWCSSFLAPTQGSHIPPHSKKIVLPYTLPIFMPLESQSLHEVPSVVGYPLKLIGEGSYAKVFKYKDEYYGKFFAVKRAKEGLSDKDYERFTREYAVLSSLRSPYFVEAYRFDAARREYVMEYVDCTLEDYIQKNSNKMAFRDRRRLVFQFLNAVQYLNDKGCLHRDLSPRNVLLKEYEDTVVLKLSDLGMVKTEGSMLTSLDTDFRGSFNDPVLRRDGFSKYGIEHEVYAATLLVFFIMTGRRNLERSTHPALEEFVKGGTSSNVEERYGDINEVRQAYLQCCKKMSER